MRASSPDSVRYARCLADRPIANLPPTGSAQAMRFRMRHDFDSDLLFYTMYSILVSLGPCAYSHTCSLVLTRTTHARESIIEVNATGGKNLFSVLTMPCTIGNSDSKPHMPIGVRQEAHAAQPGDTHALDSTNNSVTSVHDADTKPAPKTLNTGLIKSC